MKDVHIEVVLGVFTPSPNFKSKDPHILVAETDAGIALPSAPMLEQESSLQVAAKLLKDSTGLEARICGSGWIDLVPVGVADSVNRTRDGLRSIAIPYGATVPVGKVTLGPGLKWVSLIECLRGQCVEDHKELLVAIAQRV